MVTLSVKALAFAGSLVWAGAVLFVGICNLIWPAYGVAFLESLASIYPGVQITATPVSVLIGAVYAAVDGAIGGALIAWLYNKCVRKNTLV